MRHVTITPNGQKRVLLVQSGTLGLALKQMADTSVNAALAQNAAIEAEASAAAAAAAAASVPGMLAAKTDLDGGNVPSVLAFFRNLFRFDVQPEHFVSRGVAPLLREGVVDATTAIQAAITYAATNGRKVVFSGGSYRSGPLTWPDNVTIEGDQNGTFIVPTTANAVLFTGGSNATAKDFTIINADGLGGVTGFSVTGGNYVTLDCISFAGLRWNWRFDGGGHHRVSNCRTVSYAGQKSGAVWMGSSSDAAYGSVVSTVENYDIGDGGAGAWSPSMTFRRAVEIELKGLRSNITTYTGTCVLVENDCQGIIAQGTIAGWGIGLHLRKGTGIDARPIFNNFAGLAFDQNSEHAIYVEAGRGNRYGPLVTSSFVGTGTEAIYLKGSDTYGEQIVDAHVSGYYDTGGAAIRLEDTSNHLIRGLKATSCANGIVRVGTVTGVVIQGGDITDDVPQPINGAISGVGNVIRDLKGFSGAGYVATPAFPASGAGFAITNNFGVDVRVFVNSGDIALVHINGVAVAFTTPQSLIWPAGETLGFTYTGTPTWTVLGI